MNSILTNPEPHHRDVKATFVLLLLVGMLTATWYAISAPISDDLPYRCMAHPSSDDAFWDLEGAPINSVGDAFSSAVNHYRSVNGRLANLTMTMVPIMPPWLPDIACGLVAAMTIFMVMMCAFGRRGIWPIWLVAAVALIQWKWLPWHDNMVSTDFYINYGFSGLLALGYCYAFLSDSVARGARLWLYCLLAVVAGWFHEGFGLPLCATSLIFLIVWRKDDPRLTRQRIWLFGAMVVGTSLAVFAPSTMARLFRFGDDSAASSIGIVAAFFRFLLRFYPLMVYVVVLVVAVWHRGWRFALRQLRISAWWLCLAAFSILIIVALEGMGRMTWLPSLALMVATLRLVVGAFDWACKPHRIIAAILAALALAFMVSLCVWQAKVSQAQREFSQQLRDTRLTYAVVDLRPMAEIPWYTLGLPKQYSLVDLYYLGRYILPEERTLTVTDLPTAYANRQFDQWPALGSEFRGDSDHIFSRRLIPKGASVTIAIGAPRRALSPVARLLHRFSDSAAVEARIADVRQVAIPAGDTLYRYELATPRLAEFRVIESIELTDTSLQ